MLAAHNRFAYGRGQIRLVSEPASEPLPVPEHIYKITTSALWTKAQATGTLAGMPIDQADGYMHFSTADQLPETLSLHFKGQGELMLLKVPTAALGPELKWEPSRGGALFPHLYAPLATSQIAEATPISVNADGTINNLPDLS